MLSTWKTKIQSLITDDDRVDSQQRSGPAEESQVAHLRRMLAELKSGAQEPVTQEPLAADAVEPPELETAPSQITATAEVDDAAPTIGAFEIASQFVAEHRQTVESLLHELATLEECVNTQARVTEAFREYTIAKQRAADAATEARKSRRIR